MATTKQVQAAKQNIRKAQRAAKSKRTMKWELIDAIRKAR